MCLRSSPSDGSVVFGLYFHMFVLLRVSPVVSCHGLCSPVATLEGECEGLIKLGLSTHRLGQRGKE